MLLSLLIHEVEIHQQKTHVQLNTECRNNEVQWSNNEAH